MKPAFIVEGDQEKAILEKLCANHVVRPIRTNGKNFPSSTMAMKINQQLKSLINRYYPIIILFDREERKVTAEQLILEVRENLSGFGIDIGQLIIGVPDRKIENWIIPFVDSNGNSIIKPSGSEFEGKNCLGELKKRYSKIGHYEKIVIGSKLFCKIHPTELAKVSPSFKLFFEQAKHYCKWLNK